MKLIAVFAALAVWSALVFGAGMLFRTHRLLGSPHVSTTPLALDGKPGEAPGSLPSGTTLYSYGGPDEQPLFVVFVGTKELGSLAPAASGHWLEISPVVASGGEKTR